MRVGVSTGRRDLGGGVEVPYKQFVWNRQMVALGVTKATLVKLK